MVCECFLWKDKGREGRRERKGLGRREDRTLTSVIAYTHICSYDMHTWTQLKKKEQNNLQITPTSL